MKRLKATFLTLTAAAILAGCAGATSGNFGIKTLHPVADDCIGCWNNR